MIKTREVNAPPVEDRDGMLQADMAKGVNESYERLDELMDGVTKQSAKKER